MGSLYTIEYHPQLTLVSVTQHGSTATVTVIVTINGGVSAESGGIPWRSATEQLHLNSDRRDGSWKLCDTSFNGEGSGNNPAPWPSLVPPDGN
ncbi:hypothetical protein [Actinoallomurus sp. NPDC050550]|uniref:hypothetical protein n=1 Tax=Actinoallomurus sp. NPDC050550 TaxID=3154937 RepID=UPI00340012B9